MASTISGKFGEIIFARLEPREDLRQGLLRVIKEKDIKSGVILSITGALEKARVHRFLEVGAPTVQVGIIDVPGPLEASGHGIIGRFEAPEFGEAPVVFGEAMGHDEPYLHVHLTLASAKETVCGHLLDGTTIRSNYPKSHFTVIIARIEGAMLKMMVAPGTEPGKIDIGHELVPY